MFDFNSWSNLSEEEYLRIRLQEAGLSQELISKVIKVSLQRENERPLIPVEVK